MFNPKRIETIRQEIQVSALLSDHEKADWLNLLELMNDKQLGELEEILAAGPSTAVSAATAPAGPTVSTPTPIPPSPTFPVSATDPGLKLPPLSHIANMPTDVTMTHSVPSPVAVRPTPSPSLSAYQTKSNYASSPSTQVATPSSTQSALPSQPQSRSSFRPQPAPAPAPRPAPAKSLRGLSIEHVEDLQQLSLTTLRQFSLQSIFDVVRQAIADNGYFAVLQLIEASPLYIGYINAGNKRLGLEDNLTADDESGFTQEEFEFMTDLLRNMRFNQW